MENSPLAERPGTGDSRGIIDDSSGRTREAGCGADRAEDRGSEGEASGPRKELSLPVRASGAFPCSSCAFPSAFPSTVGPARSKRPRVCIGAGFSPRRTRRGARLCGETSRRTRTRLRPAGQCLVCLSFVSLRNLQRFLNPKSGAERARGPRVYKPKGTITCKLYWSRVTFILEEDESLGLAVPDGNASGCGYRDARMAGLTWSGLLSSCSERAGGAARAAELSPVRALEKCLCDALVVPHACRWLLRTPG